jgi:dihydrofolate synthase/folylpolyglutamate synthase
VTYKETLAYLYQQLPMFHRVGAAAYKANLDNTYAICNMLGNPERRLRCIHVAGTNGKGSTSHMLAAVLQSAGFKTGLYTSPHLKDFRERIRINGKMIPRKTVTDFVEKHRAGFEKIQPSFFEWTVGLAFDYFAQQNVDIAVIEVGLGGRLDSTNVIDPLVSVITNISFDHKNLLGNTLKKIAGEKAGIIKPGRPVVIGETQPEVKAVFLHKAKTAKAPITFADQQILLKAGKRTGKKLPVRIVRSAPGFSGTLQSELTGHYQLKNIAAVLQAIAELRRQGLKITAAAVRKGISGVTALTGLQGRWQTLARKPLTIADTGHNEAGIREVLHMLKQTPHRRLHVVLGMVGDKDIRNILKLLPQKATYYFCRAGIPRALDAGELQKMALRAGLRGENCGTVKKALKAAQNKAGKGDLVFVGGSTFTVAEVI